MALELGLQTGISARWRAGLGAVPTPTIFTDDFNRPDEDLETSPNWTRVGALAATAAVRSNQLAIISASESAYLCPDFGTPDHYVQVVRQQTLGTAYFECAVRVTDAGNFIGLQHGGATTRLYRVVGGTATLLQDAPASPQVGDVMRLECVGDQVTAKINGLVVIGPVTETAHQAVTRCGFAVRQSTQDPAFDDFEAGRMPPAFVDFGTHVLDANTATRTVTIAGEPGQLWLAIASLRGTGLTFNNPPLPGFIPLFGGVLVHPDDANHKALAAYRRLTATESDPVLVLPSATDEWGWTVSRFSGVGVDPIDASDFLPAAAVGNDPVCPDVATQGPNRTIVRAYIANGTVALQDSGYPASTTGIFVRQCAGAENLQNLGAAYATKAASGQTGQATFPNVTSTANITRWGFTIALRP